MINVKDSEKNDYAKIRISVSQKERWKKLCKEKNISLTSLIINSVENRMMDDERKKVLEFIEKQDNIFSKIENNINQVAKIVNTQKFISSQELNDFSEKISEISELKKVQNRIFENIYALLAK
ncbi:hypothetical protein [Chryseobacterium sp.]|uniref:hypothetical protein n=2 Tax=Chryseobacterium TaxID=59732 RepID=UPI00289F8BFB|nr:hypothetical protein [Chryseobacterium sp.]